MRFLEREVYTFCGERVRGAMPWARIFFVYGRAAENDVGGGRWTGRGWAAGSTREELAGRATRKERHAKVREKREERCFSGERLEGCLLCPPGGSRDRVAAIAALGYRRRRENGACAGCGTGWSTGGNPACGGLWPPFQLIQLIYLRYLCGSAEREKRMDVCFLLTLYI